MNMVDAVIINACTTFAVMNSLEDSEHSKCCKSPAMCQEKYSFSAGSRVEQGGTEVPEEKGRFLLNTEDKAYNWVDG